MKKTLVFLFLLNVFLRIPAMKHDLVPFTFCDEDIVTNNAYRVYHDKNWSPGQFLYGGVNYYAPAIVANIYSAVTGERLPLEKFILLGRFLFAILIASLFVPMLYLTSLNLFRDARLAWVTSLLASFSPMALGLSRHAYPDHYIISFSGAVLWLCSLSLRSDISEKAQRKYLLWAGFIAGCALGVKYYAAIFAVPMVVTQWVRKGTFKNLIQSKEIWFCGFLMILGFLLTNPFVPIEFRRFWSDFLVNVQNYKNGMTGGYSDHGIWLYSQYVFMTSFGILGGCLYFFGFKDILFKDKGRTLLLTVFPLIFIIALGRYKTNIARNMMPVLPYVFLLQGLGLWILFQKFRTQRMLRYFLMTLFFFEPLLRVGASLHNDSLRDSRLDAKDWTAQNLPLKAVIGHISGGWGVPIGAEFTVVEIPYGESPKDGKCLDYLVIDEWIRGSSGPGKSMYRELIYSHLHFVNASQFYPIEPPNDPVSRQEKILEQFDLVQEFARGYSGPGISIYKNRVPCSSNFRISWNFSTQGEK